MRPSKEDYYLNIAKEVAQRGTCMRRNYGAIIVNDDAIISTGYTGSPRGTPNCLDLDRCVRKEKNIPSGKNYELCRSVHAEANAIINAARNGAKLLNGILYLSGAGNYEVKIKPCKMCRRMIINAGIERVVIREDGKSEILNVKKWIEESCKDPFKELNEEGY